MKDDCCREPLFFSMTYEFLQTYLPKQCGRSPHTVESYRDALTLFRRYIVNVVGGSIARFTFAECTRACVLGFLQYLAESKCKPTTRNHRLAALRSYVAFAADKDISLQSCELEIKRVPQCKVSRDEKIVIDDGAMAAILDQPSNTKIGLRDRTMMILLYDTGARLAEVLGLRTGDVVIDGDNPYIRVNGKGSKQRIAPISTKTAEHLAHYLSVYHPGDAGYPQTDLVFFTVIKNVPGTMSESNVERFVKDYAARARSSCPSIPEHVHPHMFRRTRATQLYRNGVGLPLVSRLLGHASLETTRKYATPSIEMLRKAMDSVETPQERQLRPIWEGDETMMAKLCGLR